MLGVSVEFVGVDKEWLWIHVHLPISWYVASTFSGQDFCIDSIRQ